MKFKEKVEDSWRRVKSYVWSFQAWYNQKKCDWKTQAWIERQARLAADEKREQLKLIQALHESGLGEEEFTSIQHSNDPRMLELYNIKNATYSMIREGAVKVVVVFGVGIPIIFLTVFLLPEMAKTILYGGVYGFAVATFLQRVVEKLYRMRKGKYL